MFTKMPVPSSKPATSVMRGRTSTYQWNSPALRPGGAVRMTTLYGASPSAPCSAASASRSAIATTAISASVASSKRARVDRCATRIPYGTNAANGLHAGAGPSTTTRLVAPRRRRARARPGPSSRSVRARPRPPAERSRARRAARAGARSTRRPPSRGSRTPARTRGRPRGGTATRSRMTVSTSVAAASSSRPNEALWSGERITTSCAPGHARRAARRPATRRAAARPDPRSGRGSARRAPASPRVSAAPAPVRCTSGGVISSRPAQNGQSSGSPAVGGADGERERARGALDRHDHRASADRVVTELGHPEDVTRSAGRVPWSDARSPRDHRWWPRWQHRGDGRGHARAPRSRSSSATSSAARPTSGTASRRRR